MDFSLLKLLEDAPSENAGLFSGSSRLTLALTAAVIIVTAIAVYLLVTNQKLTKQIKELEEEKE